MTQAEVWRDVPGYVGRYQVSDLGRVRSVDHRVRVVPHGIETTRLVPGRVLRPGRSPSGHVTVALGRGNSNGVHTLVMLAFVGEPPDGHEVLHLDHNPANNARANLTYGTRSENLRMDYAAGRRPRPTWLAGSRWKHGNTVR